MEKGAVLAANSSFQVIESFQLVGHQSVPDHSPMERQTTLVGWQFKYVTPIYFFGSLPLDGMCLWSMITVGDHHLMVIKVFYNISNVIYLSYIVSVIVCVYVCMVCMC